MERFAMLFAVAAMLVFASPATAQSQGVVEATTPESAGQSQYQYDPDGPQTQQAIEEGIEEAVENAQENNAAVDGTEAYFESLSPEEAEASESAQPASESEESVEPSASARYEHLPDTGGAAIGLPLAGAISVFLVGGCLIRRVRTKSE